MLSPETNKKYGAGYIFQISKISVIYWVIYL